MALSKEERAKIEYRLKELGGWMSTLESNTLIYRANKSMAMDVWSREALELTRKLEMEDAVDAYMKHIETRMVPGDVMRKVQAEKSRGLHQVAGYDLGFPTIDYTSGGFTSLVFEPGTGRPIFRGDGPPNEDAIRQATSYITNYWFQIKRERDPNIITWRLNVSDPRYQIRLPEASYMSPRDFQTFRAAYEGEDVTKYNNYSKQIEEASERAVQKAMGDQLASGKKSASEVFGKIPKKAASEAGIVGTASLPVAEVMEGLAQLEARRKELERKGIEQPKVMEELKKISPAAATCVQLVEMACKRKQETAVVKQTEWEALDNASRALMKGYDEIDTFWFSEQKKAKGEYAALKGEHGDIWLTNTIIRILTASIKTGKHLLLTGEPGTSKTDTARALANHTSRKLFHMEVSGLSDVSQLEQERYIEERNGASVTTSIPTALIEALEAHEVGESVLLVIDEIARVTDPAILNPLMLLMSHGEFHAVVGKKVYTVTPERFCIVATANIMLGYNFSGNSRRGMDDALLDRFRIIQLSRPPVKLIKQIVSDRVNMNDLSEKIRDRVLASIEYLYGMADGPKSSDDIKRLITVRSMIDVTSGWMGLDPYIYSLTEAADLLLSPKARSKESLTSVVSSLEAKGW